MSPIGSVSPLLTSPLARIDAPLTKPTMMPGAPGAKGPSEGFDRMLEGLVATVDAKQDAAQALTKRVLLGESDQLHQSVIAMQESSVAFTLMVEVRNKLVESYQELMRLQV
jgi:flagellar hook-basal body complex protein FliE